MESSVILLRCIFSKMEREENSFCVDAVGINYISLRAIRPEFFTAQSKQSKDTGICTNLIPTNWLFPEWFSSMLSVNSTSPLWSQILQALRWPKRSSSSADARENFSGLILPFASHSFYFFYPVHVRSDCQVRLGMGFLVQYSRKWVQLRVQYQAICGVVNGNTLQ